MLGPGINGAVADDIARVAAIQSSRVSRDATVSAEETGGFKYIPGGRESYCAFPKLESCVTEVFKEMGLSWRSGRTCGDRGA